MRDYNFGEFIYQLRTEQNLSQRKLGELVGLSNKAVSKWENGVSKPSTNTLKKLSEVLDVSVEELLAGRRFSDDAPVAASTGAEQNVQNNTNTNTNTNNTDIHTLQSKTARADNTEEYTAKSAQSSDKTLKIAIMLVSAVLAITVLSAFAAVSFWHFNKFIAKEAPEVTDAPPEESGQPAESDTPAEKTVTLESIKKSVVKVETNLGTGSGFCAIKENWIITNYHVIKNSNKIYIIDDDENKSEISKIVFYDEEKDIAVLQVKKKFTPISLGDGNAIALQDDITVIGSPQGVLNTISVGIISNVSYEDYIVISAPISPGSSGGVLLNTDFLAVGIITATAKDEMAQNLNFAINIEELKTVEEVYNDGGYKTPDYPLRPESGSGSSSGSSTTKEEVPDYLVQSTPEYIKTEKLYRTVISIGSNFGHSIAADVDIGFIITNADGIVVYDKKFSVKKSDFVSPSNSSLYSTTIDLPVSDITESTAATGNVTVKLFYKGEELDSIKWDIDRGLPVKSESFETLTFSGDGIGSVTGIDLPYGTYDIIITYEGTEAFELELNGRNIYRYWGKTAYVYQLKPDEEVIYEGTPLKNAVFNIVRGNGPWTLTIEKADMSEEGRVYEDGITYSGSGVGYVKDIYLPYGTYNITITHTGSSLFDIQFCGMSILRTAGNVSYVYTLKPDDEMQYDGTPLPSAYFNITDADGDWTITITRVS